MLNILPQSVGSLQKMFGCDSQVPTNTLGHFLRTILALTLQSQKNVR